MWFVYPHTKGISPTYPWKKWCSYHMGVGWRRLGGPVDVASYVGCSQFGRWSDVQPGRTLCGRSGRLKRRPYWSVRRPYANVLSTWCRCKFSSQNISPSKNISYHILSGLNSGPLHPKQARIQGGIWGTWREEEERGKKRGKRRRREGDNVSILLQSQ